MQRTEPEWKTKRRKQLRTRATVFIIAFAAALATLCWLLLSNGGVTSGAAREADGNGASGSSVTASGSEVSEALASTSEPLPAENDDGQRESLIDGTDGADQTEEAEAVLQKDEEAPGIELASYIAVEMDSELDLLSLAEVTDNEDKAPVVTAEPSEIDTSYEARYEVTFTATDESGNSAEKTCVVEVARQVIAAEGQPYGETYGLQWNTEVIEGQPYLVAVNRALGTTTVYAEGEDGTYSKPVRSAPCSVGSTGNTPPGYYYTSEKYRWQYLYGDCFGQYATVIIDDFLFHSVPYYYDSPDSLMYDEYNELGQPVSMGCVRMAVENVKWIYDNCPYGFPCVIYDNEYANGPIGCPEPIRIDTENEVLRNWDPTDPDPDNPWLAVDPAEAEGEVETGRSLAAETE